MILEVFFLQRKVVFFMQRKTNTHIEKLTKMFVDAGTLTHDIIKAEIPSASPAALVWILKYRKGMNITQVKKGPRIVSYTFLEGEPLPIINGSKKIYDAQVKIQEMNGVVEHVPK